MNTITRRRGRSSAFTLIELLVVIAIIAILAAILFPVFAQAREKARTASCLSNTKQIGLGILMYLQDYDECFPRFASYCTLVPNPLQPSNLQYQMWQGAIYPYLKNWQIFSCPSDANNSIPKDPFTSFYMLSYGYNYGYLSTLIVQGGSVAPATADACGVNQWFQSVLLASVQAPANIVMVADSGGKALYATSGVTELGSMVNPPDAYPSDYYFYGPSQDGWGLNCVDYFQGTPWGDTDGFAWRHTNGGNACLVDGHAKFFRVSGGLAIGTNYLPTQSCTNVLVTDYSQYHWDPRFTSGTQR